MDKTRNRTLQMFIEEMSVIDSDICVAGEYINENTDIKVKRILCGHEYSMKPKNLRRRRGCPVCNNQIIIRGINDLHITAPDVAKYLEDPEDCLYSPKSNHKLWFKCEKCGFRKFTKIYNVNKFGICCPCSKDGFSYGEKAMMYILNVNHIQYESQKIFDWSNGKKYDFYLEDYSLIIEVQGGQHLTGVNMLSKRDEIENDKYKFNLAAKNGIKKYVYIDYSKHTLECLVQSVKNSDLIQLLNMDFGLINEKECALFASSSFKRKVWDLWNSGKKVKDIALETSLANNTICSYLHEGTKYGIVEYDGEIEKKYGSFHKVICVNTMEIFDGISIAQEKYGIDNISANCNGTIKSAGKDPITGKPLVWMYYEEYLKNGLAKYNNKVYTKVVCLNNNYLFNSMVDACSWCGLKTQSSIVQFLKNNGNHKYAGKHPITGEKLRWMYYDDYIKEFNKTTLIEYQSA